MEQRLSRVDRTIRVLFLVHDTVILLVGVGVLISTPPSLVEFGAADLAAVAWSLLPLVGGAVCLVGLLSRRTGAQVVGAFTIGAGFLVWAVAASAQPGAELVSYCVSGAFLALALMSFVRGLITSSGLMPAAGG